MALVTDYSSLKSHIADVLNRTDLTNQIENFIQQFEAAAKRGINTPFGPVPLHQLVNRGDFIVSADGTALPSDLYAVESLYHNGTTYYGPLIQVTPQEIGRLKGKIGNSGVPEYFASVQRTLRFAPVPDAAYTLQLTYWRQITNLSATITTNWLLQDHPDIYLYGALMESAPFLKHDARIPTWEKLLVDRVESFRHAQNEAILGGAVQRQFDPIGG